MEKPILQDSPSFVDLCTLHQHAMRYYRLWIYACNTVLALATLIFTVFAVSVLVDPRISLLSGVELYQPTFLYAYVALLLQCGVLQAIGCVGALRLNQRLLNTYWTLLLVLMIGDILVGLVWAFRLDHIKSSLRPRLKQKLVQLYGKDPDFTEVWDWVQTNDMCCGVEGPIDFQRLNDSTYGMIDPSTLSNDTWAPLLRHQQEQLQNQQSIPKLPSTCCVFTVNPITTSTESPPSSSEVPGSSKTFQNPNSNSGGPRHPHSSPHHKNRGVPSSQSSSVKVDRSSNDPMKSLQQGQFGGGGESGYYYLPPQQLQLSPEQQSESFSKVTNSGESDNSNNENNRVFINNPPQPRAAPPTSENFVTSNKNISYFDSANLIISDLRLRDRDRMTEKMSASAPMNYFGGGSSGAGGGGGGSSAGGSAIPPPPHQMNQMGGRVHSRRKNKHLEEAGYGGGGPGQNPDRSRYGPTTTESPQGRPPPVPIGVCVLPAHLKQAESTWTQASGYAQSAPLSSMESHGSGSFEDSAEFSSSTAPPTTPTPTSTSTTTSASTTTPSTHPSSPSSTPPTFSSSSTPPPSESSSGSSRNPHRHHNNQHKSHPFPFTVTMQQNVDGCGDKILEWVEHSSDVLFVIGFCIIVFLKGCFIAILRYEIKEMIEKIKLMNGEDAGRTAAMNELIGLTSMYESGNDDSGEREGLMSGARDTSNTNVDEGMNMNILGTQTGTGSYCGCGSATCANHQSCPAGVAAASSQKRESIHLQNHLVGNNIAGTVPPRYIGNHVGTAGAGGSDEYPRVLAVSRDSMTSSKLEPVPIPDFQIPNQNQNQNQNQNANLEDSNFISNRQHQQQQKYARSQSECGTGSAGYNPTQLQQQQQLVGNSKHYLHFPHHLMNNPHTHSNPHRNENGGRNIPSGIPIPPRNGNNNNSTGPGESESGPSESSAIVSESSIPFNNDAVTRVTNASVH